MRRRLIFPLHALFFAIALCLAAQPSWAERTFVDQLGRRVTLPDTIERAVVLQHHTLNLVAQLGATDRLVGVMDDWKAQLGSGFARLAPRVASLPTCGKLTSVNVEALAALRPQVAFVTHYAPPEMIRQIEAVGVPVVAISIFKADPTEAAKLNPTLGDEDAAYDTGLPEAIRLIGAILGRDKQAEDLVTYAVEQRRAVGEHLKNLTESERVAMYMANPDLTTYGRGKYTGIMMQKAGGRNVANAILGYKQVSMEDVLAWNPAVVFVQDRYPTVVDEIRKSQAWANVAAVKDGRVYLMPEYAKAWGHAMPEAWALGEIWMAKKLYPARFADVDTRALADRYYRRFYGTDYQGLD